MSKVVLFHGSQNIITPSFGGGKPYNDYGRGLYCTESLDLAKEWACAYDTDGFANRFTLNADGLSVLNLNGPEYNILNWLAILLENRRFTIGAGFPQQAKEFILSNYLPDYSTYDIIKGYRADDSYFAYANDFINNTLSLADLEAAMKLGKLGEQIVLKTKKAFDALTVEEPIPVNRDGYYAKYCLRDVAAREKYREISSHPFSSEEIYVLDLIRGKRKD